MCGQTAGCDYSGVYVKPFARADVTQITRFGSSRHSIRFR